MPADTTTANQVSPAQEAAPKRAAVAPTTPLLAIGDTLTVVSGRVGGAWIVEDENGVVYTAAPVE